MLGQGATEDRGETARMVRFLFQRAQGSEEEECAAASLLVVSLGSGAIGATDL